MNLDNYVPVHSRLLQALDAHPHLRVVEEGHTIVEIGDRHYVEATVLVYRDPEDPRPARGTVWEPIPGRTPFTRDSELMVAYTSALGRALGYMGHGISHGMASSDEIANRTTGRQAAEEARDAERATSTPPPPADEPKRRRKEPTEKMIGFLQKLNTERGNVLDADYLAECATDFDLCRSAIDRLQEIPRD